MALTDFTIIRKSMTSRMFSTITTALTVGIAVGLMLVLLSMRDAGRQAFERGSGNMHLLISRDSSPLESVLNGVFYVKPPQRPITWKEYEGIAAIPPLGKAEDSRMDDGYAIPVQQGDSYRGYPTLATAPEFFREFKPATDATWKLASGRYFDKEFEVVLGSAAAAGTHLKLGDKIVLTHGTGACHGGEAGQGGMGAPHVHTQYKFEVVGILEPTGTSHDRALFINLNSSWILHAFDRHELAELKEQGAAGHAAEHDHEHEPLLGVSDLTDADRLITGVLARVQTRKGSDVSAAIQPLAAEIKTMDLTVASPSDQIRKLFVIVGSINQIILAMAGAVMISSGIAIMVALYNSMEQRRRQIAVLRVLGCSRPRIFGLVVTESAILGMLGAAGGFLISIAAGMVVAGVMRERLGLIIRPTYSPDWVIGVLVGAVILAATAGIVPAVMAYRTPVVKNLKPIG